MSSLSTRAINFAQKDEDQPSNEPPSGPQVYKLYDFYSDANTSARQWGGGQGEHKSKHDDGYDDHNDYDNHDGNDNDDVEAPRPPPPAPTPMPASSSTSASSASSDNARPRRLRRWGISDSSRGRRSSSSGRLSGGSEDSGAFVPPSKLQEASMWSTAVEQAALERRMKEASMPLLSTEVDTIICSTPCIVRPALPCSMFACSRHLV